MPFAQTSAWISSRSARQRSIGPVELELLGALHRAVDRHPRHDLRVREVLRPAARLPDSLIRHAARSSRVARRAPSGAPRRRRSPGCRRRAPGAARPSPRRRRRAAAARARRCRCARVESSHIPAARECSHSRRKRSPLRPYMICTWSGCPPRRAAASSATLPLRCSSRRPSARAA